MKTKYFSSMDSFSDWLDKMVDEQRDIDEILTVVETDSRVSADLTTVCKRDKTAINRFFSALDERYHDVMSEWKEGILECVESGIFTQTGDWYSWGIEWQDEETVYIFLNVKKI